MEERLRFVARLLEGEAMSALAREFGISTKTGYKIFNRYREHGLEALCVDRRTRPASAGAGCSLGMPPHPGTTAPSPGRCAGSRHRRPGANRSPCAPGSTSS